MTINSHLPMMIFGVFPFSISTASYDQLQRSTNYQWASQSRLGSTKGKRLGIGGPAYQFIGPGDESLSLNGTIFPQYKGITSRLSLNALRLQASTGLPLPLVTTGGLLIGRYITESIQETDSLFFNDGAPKKIEFTLSLKRYNEDMLLIKRG